MQIQSRGNYFFEQTRNNNNLNKIVIQNKDNTVTMIKKDDLWRIKEANYYFADFGKINTLVDKLYNTVVYRADKFNDDNSKIFENETVIYTYDSNNIIIDKVSIAPRSENNKYHYAKLNDNNLLYQITGNLSFSSYFMDWIQMPIVSFSFNEVKGIRTDNYEAFRNINDRELKSVENNKENPYLRRFISNLWNLTAETIVFHTNFNHDKYIKVMNFSVETFDNILFDFDVYSDGEEFWINIKPTADKLISKLANKQLEENKILYDGWFFKINKDIGISITNFMF